MDSEGLNNHMAAAPSQVFIVHGHDREALEKVRAFVDRLTNTSPYILAEQRDAGRTIIEKLEAVSGDVSFVIVLATADDVGKKDHPSSQEQHRARQNVIFEIGYFIGKLTRKAIFFLKKGDIDIPSDLHGVVYTEMDTEGLWRNKLVRELNPIVPLDAERVSKALSMPA